MIRYRFLAHVPIIFPAGLAAGELRDAGTLLHARDGAGVPVLRGTAIAGVLRHAWDRAFSQSSQQDAEYWFGEEGDCRFPSKFKTEDCRLELGRGVMEYRTHIERSNRHGTPVPGGLFTVEACPPGTVANLILHLHCDDKSGGERFFGEVLSSFDDELFFGGNSARGVGRAELMPGGVKYSIFDLANLESHAAYLQCKRERLIGDSSWVKYLENERSVTQRSNSCFKIAVGIEIPRGQDILIANGRGVNHGLEPQRVMDFSGNIFWRIPGSSIRGMFRAWMNRLARMGKKRNATSCVEQTIDGDIPELDDSIQDLFGSLEKSGRIHFEDAFIPASSAADDILRPEEQERMHVAIDSISGGANDGGLFDNTVLTSDIRSFSFRVRIDNPEDIDIVRLVQTFKAIDYGLIRIGSSKASGRLRVMLGKLKGHSDKFRELFDEESLQPNAFSFELSPGEENSRSRIETESHALSATAASVLGEPFYNPYTFMPFPPESEKPKVRMPTPLTMDEQEPVARFTGVLNLVVKLRSPLMTLEASPYKQEGDHKYYHALTIGKDVIIPATGIKGALRNMLTQLTGGILSHMDPDIILWRRENNTMTEPFFLARVVEPGNRNKYGTIELGDGPVSYWVKAVDGTPSSPDEVKKEYIDGFRDGKKTWVMVNDEGDVCASTLTSMDPGNTKNYYRVKLSGAPIPKKNTMKKEGVFRPSPLPPIKLPPSFWLNYERLHKNGIHKRLERDDLVWVVPPRNRQCSCIVTADDIASLQWTRWPRESKPFADCIPSWVRQDSLTGTEMVDEVTDLFGQIAKKDDKKALSFASRVRFDNVVFENMKKITEAARTCLSPMGIPNPNNIGFYREDVSSWDSLLKGYKCYRTTAERGKGAPWLYPNQPVDGNDNGLTKLNRTVDLLPERYVEGGKEQTVSGRVKISCRSLSKRELALLLRMCALPWRLGGGKPLGLGHCEVEMESIVDEYGQELPLTELKKVSEARTSDLDHRVQLWNAALTPVDKLRYPRSKDEKTDQVGAHSWFGRFGSAKKGGGGMQPIEVAENSPLHEELKKAGAKKLKRKRGRQEEEYWGIPGQALPPLTADNSGQELYGYNIELIPMRKNATVYCDAQKITNNEADSNDERRRRR